MFLQQYWSKSTSSQADDKQFLIDSQMSYSE